MQKITVFYSEEMISTSAYSISPSVKKPKFVAEALTTIGLPIEFKAPIPCSFEDLCKVHDPEYVSGVYLFTRNNGFGTRAFDVAQSLSHTTGAMLDAAKWAIKTNTVAAALCSGFHHAHFSHGGGFCTFNGLVITAKYLLDHDLARRVAIIDCDQHYGDGTQSLLDHHNLNDQVLHITFGEHFHSRRDARAYMDRVGRLNDDFISFKPDVILYQAGADSHMNDPLGGVLSTDEMASRDNLVFRTAKRLGIPLAWNLAGGYQRDRDGGISKVVDLHLNTFRAAAEIYLTPKILRKTFQISHWPNWDQELGGAVKWFFNVTQKWPNLLLANDHTMGRIDLMANQKAENIVRGDEAEAIQVEKNSNWKELSGFQTTAYNLDFCVDFDLPDAHFSLIYDSNPDGDGGEPVPVKDNVKELSMDKVRIA